MNAPVNIVVTARYCWCSVPWLLAGGVTSMYWTKGVVTNALFPGCHYRYARRDIIQRNHVRDDDPHGPRSLD
ncbi:MAG TPA: hypothetical protein VK726_07925 [Acetobacteraceae bacterium]|nr:hypothetical protein [Acetobacteraceae bacterium]